MGIKQFLKEAGFLRWFGIVLALISATVLGFAIYLLFQPLVNIYIEVWPGFPSIYGYEMPTIWLATFTMAFSLLTSITFAYVGASGTYEKYKSAFWLYVTALLSPALMFLIAIIIRHVTDFLAIVYFSVPLLLFVVSFIYLIKKSKE